MSASVAAIVRLMRSETRQVCERQPALFDMHVPLLDAGGQSRKDFAWIEKSICVKRAFKSLLLRQVRFAEHGRHQFALFQADAMFAGQNAADFDAQLEDRRAESFGTCKFVTLHHVEDDERVKIAIAGVKHVAKAE